MDKFSNILTQEVIATNVRICLRLHKILSFRNENKEDLKDKDSTFVREIGNATNETEIYVEYHFKPSGEIAKMEEIDLEKITEIPFQTIIEYTDKNGNRGIRVINSAQKLNSDKNEVEKNADINIISYNAMKKSSLLAKEGE